MKISWHWDTSSLEGFLRSFESWFIQFGKAYLIGLPIISLGTAFIGYWIIQGTWKLYLWQEKKKKTSPPR